MQYWQFLIFWKPLLLLKLICRANELWERPKFDILKNLILHYSFKDKFSTKSSLNCTKVVFIKNFKLFSAKGLSFVKFHLVFKEVRCREDLFRQYLKNHLKIFHTLAQFSFARSERKLDYYHQRVNVHKVKYMYTKCLAGHSKLKFWQFGQKRCIEKPILLIFEISSTIYFTRLSVKIWSISKNCFFLFSIKYEFGTETSCICSEAVFMKCF